MGNVGGTRRPPLLVWWQQEDKGSLAVGVCPFTEIFLGRLGFTGCSYFDREVDRKNLERPMTLNHPLRFATTRHLAPEGGTCCGAPLGQAALSSMPSWPHQALPKVTGVFLTWFSRVPDALLPKQLTPCVPGSSPDCTSGFGVLEADLVS